MLARSGPIPRRGEWSFEVKWDGFRALASNEGAPLRVRSRRGWDMTNLVPELTALLFAVTLDGELVAFGPDGAPDFPLLCERMLMPRPGIPVTYMMPPCTDRRAVASARCLPAGARRAARISGRDRARASQPRRGSL
jgi:hypothetical protein